MCFKKKRNIAWSWFCRNKVNLLFVVLLIGAIGVCVFFCFTTLNPLTKTEYVFTCESEDIRGMLLNISKLEGTVTVLQRTIPVYASLLIAVVLFLTWRQQETVKNAAVVEIHSTFKQHEQRLEAMEADAKEKVEKIDAHYKASEAVKNVTKERLMGGISDMQNILDGLE